MLRACDNCRPNTLNSLIFSLNFSVKKSLRIQRTFSHSILSELMSHCCWANRFSHWVCFSHCIFSATTLIVMIATFCSETLSSPMRSPMAFDTIRKFHIRLSWFCTAIIQCHKNGGNIDDGGIGSKIAGRWGLQLHWRCLIAVRCIWTHLPNDVNDAISMLKDAAQRRTSVFIKLCHFWFCCYCLCTSDEAAT